MNTIGGAKVVCSARAIGAFRCSVGWLRVGCVPHSSKACTGGALFTPTHIGKRWCSTEHHSAAAQVESDQRDSVGGSEEADLEETPRRRCDAQLVKLLQDAVPLQSTEEIKELIKGAKNSAEVRRVLENVVYRHHLCYDLLNGHGYRVLVLQALTMVAPRTQSMYEWFDCLKRFRRMNFVLTRTFAAEGFTVIRQWLTHTFDTEGRTPRLVTEGLSHVRQLMYWCQEDGLVFDHVLYTRIVFLLTMTVSYFDRQNLFRSTFRHDFVKRDGIVVEWVVGNVRCVDFDECVLQCDALMEEVLENIRHDIPSRPNFSIVYRLVDYYFATDNVEKMIAVMEDAQSYGVNIAESSTAKLMQLACAFNYPNVPELFLRWRVTLPQCVIAPPDMSRLLFYYGRSGGGRPCPACGEPYNHRNMSVYCWQQTPPHQRRCPLLTMARTQKGELEENLSAPQNADWSDKAFQLYELSRARSIEWGASEWRAFLLCCMFSPRAMEAKALLDRHFDGERMDDFLRATYIRLLRHHAPEEAVTAVQLWQQKQVRMSPIALQEALMAAACVPDAKLRYGHLRYIWELLMNKNSYVMPFTKRFFEKVLTAHKSAGSWSSENEALFKQIVGMRPRQISLLDMKDSASDFVMGTSKKNVYIPLHALGYADARSVAQRRK